MWVRTDTAQVYILAQLASGLASWTLASPGASDVDTLTGDSGGAISPAAGNITLAGGTNIASVGSGSTITFNLDAAISLATSVTSPLYLVGAATDMSIRAATGQDIIMRMGDASGVNKVSFHDSADMEVAAIDSNGGFTMGAITFTGLLTAAASATIETAGTALNLGSDNSGDAVNLGVGTVARAINIGTSAAAHVVSIGNAAAGAITVDTAAGISLDAVTASNFTVTGTADLSLISTAGSINISGGEAATDAVNIDAAAGGIDMDCALQLSLVSSEAAVADAIRIFASAADGGIDIDAGTGGITIDSTDAISIDGAAASNFSVSGAGVDLSLISAAGRVLVNGEEAAPDAVRILSAAGGLDTDVALQLSLVSSQAAAADSIRIFASAADGGIDIDCGSGGMTLDSTGILEINSSGGVIGIGNDAVAQNINIGTGAAARTVTVGNTTTTSGLVLQAGTGDITMTGTVKEINAELINVSGDSITFEMSPSTCTAANTGGAATGGTGDVNILSFQQGFMMEQFVIGAGQTIIKPVMDANGLLISGDLIATEGYEYNLGAARVNSRCAFTIGTSPAFFLEAELFVADMSGGNPYVIGFRRSEANNGTFANYTDYAAIGLNSVTSATEVTILTELNAGGQTATNTTDLWGGDASAQTVRVLVSAAGVVTFEVGGAPATVAPSYTFDNGDVVCPFIHLVHGAVAPGAVNAVSWRCGFQA